MRRYSLVPVRYNEQQLLVRCEPIDAELWSIQWQEQAATYSDYITVAPDGKQTRHYHRTHWFADVAPLERDNAEAIVTWLNNRESFAATLPPLPANLYRAK